MAEFEVYLSDGEGPTRVYPMYRDEDGDWQVSTTYIDLEFIDAYDSEPIGPALWDEQYQEIKKFYTNVQGTRLKKAAGYRYFLHIEWPAGSLADRGDIVSLANTGIGQRVRVYPHNDSTLIHFDCIVSANNVTARHHVDGIRYPDYSPMIEFTGVNIVKMIPHNYSAYHYFFVDKTAWAAYTAAEQRRAVTMRDTSDPIWPTYLTSDFEGYFTRKNLEQVPGE